MSREVPVTGSYKVGLSKGRPRIWIDGKKLAEAGFVGGSTYYYEVWAGINWLSCLGVYFCVWDVSSPICLGWVLGVETGIKCYWRI
jgi:hypothetical protein